MSNDAKYIRKVETEGYEAGALKSKGKNGKARRRAFKKAAYNALRKVAYRDLRRSR